MEPTRVGNYSPVQVVNFFLFNTAWGTKEGEEEKKLVYFWPEDAETDTKLRKLGLVEGVVNFASRFSIGQHPPHSLHTLKQRMVFLEVENDYWLCLVVAVPNTRKQQQQNKGSDTNSGTNTSSGATASGGGGGDVIEFYPEDVGDEVLLSLLKRAYAMFSLFHSGLAASLVGRCGGNIKLFVDVCQHFFSRYLGTLRVDRSDLTYIWGGIQYLAVEMVDFLRVQSIVNRIKADHDNMSMCLFLQSGQLIWSDVDPDLTKLLVQYLSTTILASLNTIHRKPCGSFLVGDEDQLPKVFLSNRSYHLAVYHVVNTTLVLLLKQNPSQTFYARFKDNPGQELGNLSADLTHTYISKQASSSSAGGSRSEESVTSPGTPSAALLPSATSSSSDSVMFLYFNASNLAVKSTVGEGHSKAIMLAQDMIQDLRLTTATVGGLDGQVIGEGEVVSRLSTDEWVVVQVAGARTIVVVLTDKNINLMDVAESVSRLKKTSFDNICML